MSSALRCDVERMAPLPDTCNDISILERAARVSMAELKAVVASSTR